jgi:hypothetical protein
MYDEKKKMDDFCVLQNQTKFVLQNQTKFVLQKPYLIS